MRSFYKILHTTGATQWGGIEKRLLDQLVWMAGDGHHPVLICPKDSPLFLKAKESGIKTYFMDFNPLASAGNYQRIQQILYNEKPDILHAEENRGAVICLHAARKLDIPLRILCHHDLYPIRKTPWTSMMYKRLCHYIFTLSRHHTGYIQKRFGLKDMKVFTMPFGISWIPDENLPDKQFARKELLERLGIDPGEERRTKWIGVSGPLSTFQDHETLSKALQTLGQQGTKARLVTITSPASVQDRPPAAPRNRPGMEETACMDPEDAPHCVRGLDAWVLPGLDPQDPNSETGRRCLLQAMMWGVPVIGPASETISDVLTHEKTGLVFENGNQDDLALKIRDTLEDFSSAEIRTAAARRFIQKHHSIDALGRDTLRIYSLHQIRMKRPGYQG